MRYLMAPGYRKTSQDMCECGHVRSGHWYMRVARRWGPCLRECSCNEFKNFCRIPSALRRAKGKLEP